MSHQSTPHLNNKKTPLAADSNGAISHTKQTMDKSAKVSDAQAANTKQLLNAYVYDFLVKSRLPQTAKIFVNEAEVPSIQNSSSNSNNNSPHQTDPNSNNQSTSIGSPNTPSQQFQKENNLPISMLAMDAPQGFLYEWWSVFWDVMQAKNNKGSSQSGSQYYQMQLMKQRQQQELQGLNIQPPMLGVSNQMSQLPGQQQQQMPMDNQQRLQQPQQFAQPQSQQQLDQQRYMMQMMVKQQMQMMNNPMDPQQQQMLANMGPNNNLAMQQRMLMSQPQSQNRIQQHAQTQMNNLRQQAAVAAQQHHPQSSVGQPQIPDDSSPSTAPRMNSQISPENQAAPPPINGMPFQPPVINGASQASVLNQQQRPSVIRMNSNNKPIPYPNGDNSIMMNSNTAPNGNGLPNARNMNALQDYQMQLMLLEKQNKKRLEVARNTVNADPNAVMGPNPGILPPQQIQSSQQKQSPATIGSPNINSKSTATVAANKRKKEAPAKKGRKPSASSLSNNTTNKASTTNIKNSSNSTGGNNSVHNNTNANGVPFKKEYSAPLTPATPTDAVSKRKRKSSANVDSPNKQVPGKMGTTAGRENPIPEEPSTKKEEGMLPPTSGTLQDSNNHSNEQIFPIEILGANGGNDSHFFGSSNGALDEIDFDFNQFLDGSGDNSLNEGMSGFNWGNADAIENGD